MIWAAAFLEGVLSCLSPCVLPLLPGYISALMMAVGDSGARGGGEPASRPSGGGRGLRPPAVLPPTLLFVAGLSFAFTLLGLGATTAGRFLASYLDYVEKVAAAVIVLFGVSLLGIRRAPLPLEREVRPLYSIASGKRGLMATFVLGAAFAVGWTPCIGPVLGSILAMAATAESAWRGAGLLFAYAMGLGFPFLATAAAFQWGQGASVWRLGCRAGAVGRVARMGAGALLVAFGAGMFFGLWRS